jgi:hypothetical protein
MQVQFIRPILAKSSDVVISSTTDTKFIWAVHSSRKPIGTALPHHTTFGSRSGNMFAKSSAFPAVEDDASDKTRVMAGGDGFAAEDNTRENYILLQYVDLLTPI